MANRIGWTTCTLNLFGGCTKVSDGCSRCYAERMAVRLAANPLTPQYSYTISNGHWTGKVWMDTEEQIRAKFAKLGKKPKMVFLGSMGDLFHPEIPADFITFIFECMEAYPQHHFVILTKRPERLIPVLYGEEGHWFLGGGDNDTPNVFIGVSVENQAMADLRIPELLRFKNYGNGTWKVGISAEPLLGHIKTIYGMTDTGLGELDWVITGSETGHNARRADSYWFRQIADQCIEHHKPLYLKQMGSKQHQDRILYDQEWNDTAWGWK